MEINRFADLTDDEFVSQYASGASPTRQVDTEALVERLHADDNESRMLADTDDADLPLYLNWNEKGFVSRPYD